MPPLQIPTAEQIEARIHLRMQGQQIALTDLTTIGTARILIREAFIEEFMGLWAAVQRIQRDWFIQTATGAALDRRLADFDLVRPGGAPATGAIAITVDADQEIPAGAVLRTSTTDGSAPKTYRVLPNPAVAGGAWPILAANGVRRDIAIIAEQSGAAGNTASNTIRELVTSIANVTSVTNETPVINGKDAASDGEFRQYFRDWLLSLTRGTRPALTFAILNYVDPDTGRKPVHSLSIVEWGGETLLGDSGTPVAQQIYIEDGTGSAPAALVDAIRAYVYGNDTDPKSGHKAAGVPTAILSATPFPLNVDVAIDADRPVNALTVQANVRDAIATYLGNLPVGGRTITGESQGQLNFAQLFRAVMNVAGVLRATFTTPQNDLACPVGHKFVPASINVAVVSVT